jgi:hypothetical protein
VHNTNTTTARRTLRSPLRATGRTLAAAISAALLVLAVSAQADEASSTNFSERNTAIDGFGGQSSSTSFTLITAGEVISGESTSTSFYLKAGPLNFDVFSPRSRHWRWYDDEENETPSSSLAAENSAPTDIQMGEILKLRMTLKETASIGGSGVKFRIQYSDTSDFSANVRNVFETGSCTTTSTWCYASASGTDNAIISTSVLSDADSCSGGAGNGCGTHNTSGVSTSSFAHAADAATEYEFALKQRAAAVNTVYFFRAFDVNEQVPVPLFGTSTYPSLVTGGATLTFTVSGLPNGTSTEGVVTDTTTTADTVPFGALLFGNEVEAAQRLTVTTNATDGYQIFLFEDQQFMNQSAGAMPRIAAPNSSPAAWGTACYSTSTGCYGYHAGDDALSGGSVRFAPDDTYARFATTTDEIAFSSSPAASDTVDVVFKTEVRTGQEAGAYQNRITYIIVPVF